MSSLVGVKTEKYVCRKYLISTIQLEHSPPRLEILQKSNTWKRQTHKNSKRGKKNPFLGITIQKLGDRGNDCCNTACASSSSPSSSCLLIPPKGHSYRGPNLWQSTLAIGGIGKPVGRRGLLIRSTATKTPKSPADEEWKVKREVLLQKRVRSVDVKESLRLQQENKFIILDVRPEAEFREIHPGDAINVQLFRLIKEWTAWDIARRVAFAFFGIFSGTEENPEFIQLVESKVDKEAKIIVGCTSGGTMRPSPNLPEGRQSRSLIAAYLLVLNGFSNVYHMEGGLYTWFKENLPCTSEDD